MRRVAYLTAAHLFEQPCPDPAARHEHDLQLAVLQAACAPRGIELQPVVWRDADVDASAFDAFVLGTAWDYAEYVQAFLSRLETWSRSCPILNPLEVVRWNLEKTYLRDLEARGVPVVPTLWRESAEAAGIVSAFDELGTDAIVVKPVVGQNAWRQVRLERGDDQPRAAELPPAATMIQPYLPAIETEGELSVLSFDREFSHALRKLPRAGDYRIQASFGGREERHEPSAEELELVERTLAAVAGPLLYARVDLVRTLDGSLAVMELELIEPYFFPEQGGGAGGVGRRFVTALERLLETGPD